VQVDDTPELFADDTIKSGGPTADAPLIHALTRDSGDVRLGLSLRIRRWLPIVVAQCMWVRLLC